MSHADVNGFSLRAAGPHALRMIEAPGLADVVADFLDAP